MALGFCCAGFGFCCARLGFCCTWLGFHCARFGFIAPDKGFARFRLARRAADRQTSGIESGCSGRGPPVREGGARMRLVFLIAMLAALTGCASYRDVTFLYYPNAPPSNTFPRASEFYAEASRECA